MSYMVAENLSREYGRGEATVTALAGVDFSIESGEFVAVMGESGAGKSTLLSVLGAMNAPTAGRYKVDDIDVYGLNSEQRADFRREYLGFVFQSFHLIPYLTVLENVLLPLTTVKASRKEKRALALEALAQVGLPQQADRLPGEISGGEKERVAVARAIVNAPPVLMADEPTGNLDSRNTREIMRLLQRLNADGTTIVMVTHSTECAAFAERILNLSDGHLVSDARKQDLGEPKSTSLHAVERKAAAP